MIRSWTFGKKIAAGYVIAVVCIVAVGTAASYNLRKVIAAHDVVESHFQNMLDAEDLRAATLRQSSEFRGYLLVGDQHFIDEMQAAQARYRQKLALLAARVLNPEGKQQLAELQQTLRSFSVSAEQLVAMRRGGTVGESLVKMFETRSLPERQRVEHVLNAFVEHEQQLVQSSAAAADRAEARAAAVVIGVAISAALVAVLLTVLLSGSLARSIAPAVQHVQVSVNQLQSAANQQASGSKQHAAVMAEIMTTMKELLATSRQIADNAQRAAAAAAEGSTAAHGGEQIVNKAQAAVSGIKRQFDQTIEYMLGLGKKSHQIGAILDIVNELAEQTNILAINATIEAAGSGEAGKRFGAVADEIRKLADRVTSSANEIRDLIEQVRTAVNATAMAAESSSKVVETGVHEVGEVATAFSRIATLIESVTEAAREIELNTKQQSSAVSQVNTAVSEVAQAAKELETASAQTLQTSSMLSNLSHDLARLIQPDASAA